MLPMTFRMMSIFTSPEEGTSEYTLYITIGILPVDYNCKITFNQLVIASYYAFVPSDYGCYSRKAR